MGLQWAKKTSYDQTEGLKLGQKGKGVKVGENISDHNV